MPFEHVEQLPAWLAFFGAILVALIAAGTAQWRLRTQLKAEAERHAEQGRRERELQDIQELRAIVDRATTELAALLTADAESVARMVSGERLRRSDLGVPIVNCVTQKERLATRLGREHPVTTTYNAALDAVVASHRSMVEATERGESQSVMRAAKRASFDAVDGATNAFTDTAFTTIHSRLGDPRQREGG